MGRVRPFRTRRARAQRGQGIKGRRRTEKDLWHSIRRVHLQMSQLINNWTVPVLDAIGMAIYQALVD
jgi:hypothetical protein